MPPPAEKQPDVVPGNKQYDQSFEIYNDNSADDNKGADDDDDDDFSPVDPPIDDEEGRHGGMMKTSPPSLCDTTQHIATSPTQQHSPLIPSTTSSSNKSRTHEGKKDNFFDESPTESTAKSTMPASKSPAKEAQQRDADEMAAQLQWRQRTRLSRALQRDWEAVRRSTYHRLRVDSFDNGTSNAKEKYDFALQRRGYLASDRDSLGDRYLPIAYRQRLEKHLVVAQRHASAHIGGAMFAHQDPAFKKELLKRRMGHRSKMTLQDANARTAAAGSNRGVAVKGAGVIGQTFVEDKYAPIPPPPSTCYNPLSSSLKKQKDRASSAAGSTSNTATPRSGSTTPRSAKPLSDVPISVLVSNEATVQEDGCVNVANLFIRGGALPDDGREMKYLRNPFSVSTLFNGGGSTSDENVNATPATNIRHNHKKNHSLMSSLPIERPQSVDHVLQLKALFLHWAGGGIGGSANGSGVDPVIPLNGPYAPDVPALVHEGVTISNFHRRKNGAAGAGGGGAVGGGSEDTEEGSLTSSQTGSSKTLSGTTNMTTDLFTVPGCASSRDGGIGTERWGNIVFDWLDLLGCFRRPDFEDSDRSSPTKGPQLDADAGDNPTEDPSEVPQQDRCAPRKSNTNTNNTTPSSSAGFSNKGAHYDATGTTIYTMTLSDWLMITCCDLIKDWEMVANMRNEYETITSTGEIFGDSENDLGVVEGLVLSSKSIEVRPRTVAGIVRAMERARCKLQNSMKLNVIANSSALKKEQRREMTMARRRRGGQVTSPRRCQTPNGVGTGFVVSIPCPPPIHPLLASRPTSASKKKKTSASSSVDLGGVAGLEFTTGSNPGDIIAASTSRPSSAARHRPGSASSRSSSATRRPTSAKAASGSTSRPTSAKPPSAAKSNHHAPPASAPSSRPASASAKNNNNFVAIAEDDDNDEGAMLKRLHRMFIKERQKAATSTLLHTVRDVWKLLACGLCLTDHDYEELVLDAFDAQVAAQIQKKQQQGTTSAPDDVTRRGDDDYGNASTLFVDGVDDGVVIPPLGFSACMLLLLSHRTKMYLAKGTLRMFPGVLPPMEMMDDEAKSPPSIHHKNNTCRPPSAVKASANSKPSSTKSTSKLPAGITVEPPPPSSSEKKNDYQDDDFEASDEDDDVVRITTSKSAPPATPLESGDSSEDSGVLRPQVHPRHPIPPPSMNPHTRPQSCSSRPESGSGRRPSRPQSASGTSTIKRLRHYHNPVPVLHMPMPRTATPSERSAAIRFYSSVTPGGRKAVLYTMKLMQQRTRDVQEDDENGEHFEDGEYVDQQQDPHLHEEGYVRQRLQNGEVRWTRKIVEQPIPRPMTEASKRVRAASASRRGTMGAGVPGDVGNSKRAMLDNETRNLRYARNVWK